MEFTAWLKDIGLIAAFGGICCLDRRGAFQLMLSQPIVAVPVLGWLFGESLMALQLGALLQLIWMGSIHLGVSNPPHETLASITTGAIVLLHQRYFGPSDEAVWSLATICGLPIAILGKALDVQLEKSNISLNNLAQKSVSDGELRIIDQLPIIGLTRSFLWSFLLTGIAAALGTLLVALVRPFFWGSAAIALKILSLYILPALGIGISLSIFRQRRTIALACVACLSTALVMLKFFGGKA